jgi:hypothetical protein
MYDFYFGSAESIRSDEKKFLLSIKRMLPRWVNSIPDSEYLAIADLLQEHVAKPNPILVETGVGASTIVLLHHALKHGGLLYSWDLSGPKGAYLRGVCQDTLLHQYRVNIFDHWTFVAYDSLSPHLGLAVLKELGKNVDFCFLDSEHTLDTVLGELTALEASLRDGSIIAIDDANYTFRHTNYAYINMQRRKLGLSSLSSPAENNGAPFYQEVEDFLGSRWRSVTHLPDNFKSTCREDLFFSYFQSERRVMDSAGMEKLADLEHRFDAWRVADRDLHRVAL